MSIKSCFLYISIAHGWLGAAALDELDVLWYRLLRRA